MTMTTSSRPTTATSGATGDAMASFVAAGIGAFAMGIFVLLNETELYVAPTMYAPAGGVSGRTTLAAMVWLVAWAVLHFRWRARDIPPGPVLAATLILTLLGVLACFPPVWGLL